MRFSPTKLVQHRRFHSNAIVKMPLQSANFGMHLGSIVWKFSKCLNGLSLGFERKWLALTCNNLNKANIFVSNGISVVFKRQATKEGIIVRNIRSILQ